MMLDVDWSLIASRAMWLGSGMVIGYMLGWFKAIRCTERYDVIRKDERGEAGFMRHPFIADILFLVITCVTVYAAFQSQAALNRDDEQIRLLADNVVVADAKQQCTTNTMFAALDTLNSRTRFSGEQAEANIELQKSQLPLVRAIFTPVSDLDGLRIAQRYLNALEDFLRVAKKSSQANSNNPIPTLNGYLNCLREARAAD